MVDFRGSFAGIRDRLNVPELPWAAFFSHFDFRAMPRYAPWPVLVPKKGACAEVTLQRDGALGLPTGARGGARAAAGQPPPCAGTGEGRAARGARSREAVGGPSCAVAVHAMGSCRCARSESCALDRVEWHACQIGARGRRNGSVMQWCPRAPAGLRLSWVPPPPLCAALRDPPAMDACQWRLQQLPAAAMWRMTSMTGALRLEPRPSGSVTPWHWQAEQCIRACLLAHGGRGQLHAAAPQPAHACVVCAGFKLCGPAAA